MSIRSQDKSKVSGSVPKDAGVEIRIDGLRHRIDNVFGARLRGSVKYEALFLHELFDIAHLEKGVERYLAFYDNERRQ